MHAIICVEKGMNENILMLNDKATEVLLSGSAGSLRKLEFDRDLSSSSHKNALIQTMYLELRKIGQIRHLIITYCAALLLSSLVFSNSDYCNSLLAGLPSERLKRLQFPNSSE